VACDVLVVDERWQWHDLCPCAAQFWLCLDNNRYIRAVTEPLDQWGMQNRAWRFWKFYIHQSGLSWLGHPCRHSTNNSPGGSRSQEH
jgi:hypothetical protein